MKNTLLFACAALIICGCSNSEHPEPGVSYCSEPKMDEASHQMIQICGESEEPQIENMQCNENGLCFGSAKIRQPKSPQTLALNLTILQPNRTPAQQSKPRFNFARNLNLATLHAVKMSDSMKPTPRRRHILVKRSYDIFIATWAHPQPLCAT